MNERIKELAEQAGLYDEKTPEEVPLFTASFEKFAELLIRKCAIIADTAQAEDMGWDIGGIIREHFGVEEPKGWVCNKCGTDRTKSVCPYGHTAALTGECPMVGVAQ
jgi:hypothetical protein